MIQGGKNLHVPIPENGRVIDLGCGPATWTMDMATDMSTVNFVGIDISPIFPTAIHPRNCSFFCENILTGLAKSQPDGCYDVVFQRNVSAGFTAQDWQTAVREAYRLCKPGGWFESVESDASVHDAGPKTTLLFDFMLRSMGARLVDPTAVRTLSQMMIEAGFVDVQVKEYSVPLGEWGGKLGQLWKQNIGAILETVTPHLAKAASKPDSHIREMVKDMMQNETKEHRAYQTIYVAFGRKPSSE
ncbi:hypothetical protein BGW38_003247 [Lunasporangiospora selenospora]|uniref:Methyltransferase domain-containing protein n=1 Tax=Lunasporangiospora selenospora TaxID=979761 RepID=A0A9P6FRS2_9FUNG|nr:hypothetical protein BGW38_003247 [Lunasporangiospora selenospora]